MSDDENLKPLGLGESIHEPIINLDSNVPVSLPDTQYLNSGAFGQDEPYQSQAELYDKHRDAHPELDELSEEGEE